MSFGILEGRSSFVSSRYLLLLRLDQALYFGLWKGNFHIFKGPQMWETIVICSLVGGSVFSLLAWALSRRTRMDEARLEVWEPDQPGEQVRFRPVFDLPPLHPVRRHYK